MWHPTHFRGKCTKEHNCVTQTQRPHGTEKLNYLFVQVQRTGMQWWVHRKISGNIWWKVKRIPQCNFTYTESPDHTRQPITLENFSVVGRDWQSIARTIKESIFIWVNKPTLNETIGKYNLPHIWDGFLNNTPSQEPARTETSASAQNIIIET